MAALTSFVYGASVAPFASMAPLASLMCGVSTRPTGSCAPSIGPTAASGAMQTPRATSQTFPPVQSPDF
jgi:hypothetical protein